MLANELALRTRLYSSRFRVDGTYRLLKMLMSLYKSKQVEPSYEVD